MPSDGTVKDALVPNKSATTTKPKSKD